ncbi:MAG TPA: hypothetical protein VF771_08380 [Longimicrobiaceae bacterium]
MDASASSNHLVAEAEAALAASPRALEAMRAALAIRRAAAANDAALCREMAEGFEEMVLAGEMAYHEAEAFLAGDTGSAAFAEELFWTMRALIDASLHPLLLELLAQRRIARGKRPELAAMAAMHFSYAVEELTVTAPVRELMEPPPWGFRVSDWRIAASNPAAPATAIPSTC